MPNRKIQVGIGFATGRKSFKRVLRSYVYHLEESNFLSEWNADLSLFVAFDPEYSHTAREDYAQIEEEVLRRFASAWFFSPEDTRSEAERLAREGALRPEDARLAFGNGYAAQRNMVVYQALRRGMDYLIFFDDDEYPMAVTNSQGGTALWSGQHVIESHVKYLQFSDITNGHHCGYVSPLPLLEMDGILNERIFRRFIEAMSSDVLQWDELAAVLKNGGVTYADKQVLIRNAPELVEEAQGAKFITGGNLGLNLTDREKVLPFYNPPGARGEDSFLSTCLHRHTVKSIPVYTFHDGFSLYENLLKGVLPTNLRRVSLYDSHAVTERFLRACLGWVRYKPLYTRITRPGDCQAILDEAEAALTETIPNVCAYFNDRAFAGILAEFRKYRADAPRHLDEFARVREIWAEMKKSL